MRLTKRFAPDLYARALSSWSWAGLAGKTARFTSLFGDVFFEADDGAWWFLDGVEGTFTRVWDSRVEMEFTLAGPGGRDRYLLAHMVAAAEDRGIVACGNQVYAFVPPPIVRGGLDADSLHTLDFVVAVNIAGQIHEQIRELSLAS
jgi:hypothetical protein